MRTSPHTFSTHPPYDEYGEAAPAGPHNPYDELADLSGPLDEFLRNEPEDDEPWEPPQHRRGGRRRRRNRFAGLPLVAKALVLLLAGAAFLVLADRWALLYAEHKTAEKLKDSLHLTAAPEVEIEGFPFLTQALDERIDEASVTVPDVAADRVSLAKVSATASDVTIDGGPLSVKGASVGEMNGEVLLSFEDLNRELGASQVTFTAQGRDRVLARGTLPVAGHDLKLSADAQIRRSGEKGISTRIGGMRLDIGDLATYRPGTKPSQGLHLSRKSADSVRSSQQKLKSLFAVPALVDRLGIPRSAVQRALHEEADLSSLTGSPRFVRDLMGLNLIDVAMDHPALLKQLGLDPALLDGLSRLTRPALADRLALGFRLPELPDGSGELYLKDVRVERDGIRVELGGSGVSFGG
ncbi:LmeA family phospholipid-binding protein [Streptomyces mesophilus]|uniref:LmeA family phospholipid-binding protein n=1 Tax=Streptomyces mesophilus TaxID=1775132 RepID=UPI0033336AA2